MTITARMFRCLMFALALALTSLPVAAKDSITIAAAADLKFAMDDIVTAFEQAHPADTVKVIYGSSGKFTTQIEQGAPFDLFFAADIRYPQALAQAGLTASPPARFGTGRIVLWSVTEDARKLTLQDLARPQFRRIAIANPEHAPYGVRAVQALKAAGVWASVKPRLVYGENIGQTAQFVQSGNAQVGIIALALAVNPAFAARGGYAPIPDTLYDPLVQGFVITRRAAGNPVAAAFAHFIDAPAAQAILRRYGFAGVPPASTR